MQSAERLVQKAVVWQGPRVLSRLSLARPPWELAPGLALPRHLPVCQRFSASVTPASMQSAWSLFLFQGPAWLCHLPSPTPPLPAHWGRSGAREGRTCPFFMEGVGKPVLKFGMWGNGLQRREPAPVHLCLAPHWLSFAQTWPSFGAQVRCLMNTGASTSLEQPRLWLSLPHSAITSTFSDCQAPGWPLVGLWFRPFIQHRGRGVFAGTGPGRFH